MSSGTPRDFNSLGIGDIGNTCPQTCFIHKSLHLNGARQVTLLHWFWDTQFLWRCLNIVAWPHWVPFNPGGRGRCFPSKRISSRQPKIKKNHKITKYEKKSK